MKRISLYVMSTLYFLAGINHFIHPDFYIHIMPHWIPYHPEMIAISGVFEILFSLMLLFPKTRNLGAWGIILMLLVFFAVHIQMLVDWNMETSPPKWVLILRIPIQFVLLWWAYGFTNRKATQFFSS